MQNYHRHSCYSNIFTPDSPAMNEDYAKRAVELGHKIISSVEHGFQGYYFETFELAQKYNLKCVIGAEAYWVKDRKADISAGLNKKGEETFTKDKTNNHIIILAKNNNGREAINDILSEASISGYYYKPRIDLKLLSSLPADDVFITSACIAFNGYGFEYSEKLIAALHRHFKSNFMLEIQYHNTDNQKKWNRFLLEMSKKYGIELIVGLDSHYIFPEESIQRDVILDAKDTHYDDEEGWYMDYPSDDIVMQRFLEQGIFTREQIQKAMDNTDICLTFDDYDNVPIFNKDIKLPSLYLDETKEQKDKRYSKLISEKFKEYTKDFSPEEYKRYFEGVKNEVQTYKDTGMCDYPLLDYAIVTDAVNHGGLITDSGRGCFTKDALVHTDNGLKSIADVNINDCVIDMNGEFKKVINTMKYHIKEDLIKISYLYGDISKYPNICTRDHKILIHRNDENQWIEAKNIVKGDYVCLPKVSTNNTNNSIIDLNDYNIFNYDFDENYIYEYSPFINNEYSYSPREISKVMGVSKKTIEDYANGLRDDFPKKPGLLKSILEYIPFNSTEEYRMYIRNMRTIKIHRYINLDYEFGQFVGLMYGDGCNCSDRNEISLAVNKNTSKDKVNRTIFENTAARFGIKSYCHSSKNRNLNQLGLRSKLISNLISTLLFTSKNDKDKQFNKDLYFYNDSFKKGILNGLFLSDGSNCERKSFDNTSLSLINAFKILSLMECDMPIVSLTVREGGIDNRGYNRKCAYKLRYASNPFESIRISERCLKDDKYWYLPVKYVEKLENIETDVYDLTIEDSHSYLLNNMIVHNSAVGFFTNTLCGFSKVDRFKSAIKLYPERFISTTRILETHSLPDIDLNVGTVEIFEDAQKRVLGEDHVAPMIAFGTLKKKSAFKLYARAKNMDFQLANTITEQITKYDEAVKYADDDDKDLIDIYDYVDEQYREYIEQSKEYWGVISDKKKAPSAYLLYQGNIRREIGLIKCKSESTKKEYITCVIDGMIAENYKFLKNDILKVDVVLLIDKVFKRIGIEHFDVNTLIEKVTDNQKVWDIYANGYTIGVNQIEREGSKHKCMNYKPQNISELSAFVAAIRPGFKSMYDKFESREDFSWGISVLDNLVKTKELPVPFLFYQEQVMSVLNYAGFPMDECYGIIKAIAKKHPEKVRPLKSRFIDGFRDKIIIDENLDNEIAQEYAERVWIIINDNCGYGFNSAHAFCMALDSLYQAWQKAYYPYEFYEVLLQHYTDKGNKDKVSLLKNEMKKAFGINEGSYKWKSDNRTFVADKDNHCINPALSSLKGFSIGVAEDLYSLFNNKYNNFIELLIDLENTKINSSQINVLISLDYFSEFGDINTLLKEYEIYTNLHTGKKWRKQLSPSKCQELNIPIWLIQKHAQTQTDKVLKDFDPVQLCIDICNNIDVPKAKISDKLNYQLEYMGYINITISKLSLDYYYILEVSGKWCTLYQLHSGDTIKIKFKNKPTDINVGDTIKILEITEEKKWGRNASGEWYRKDETEPLVSQYKKLIAGN